MITIEIIKCKDALALGQYEYQFDQITIGRSRKNDLIFLDAQLPLNFLIIKFIQGQLVIQSKMKEPFFFVNRKKISGMLKLKINDVIAFGDNQLRITNASMSAPHADFSAAYEDFNNKSYELKFALEFIEEVLIDLEKDPHV
jgi:hypothetical protein